MIRILPAPVADAIAAGEVIERPAAVVKELIENALDAGARHISVEVRGAGRTLIRVVDDGGGIPPEELELAFQRHATSKLVEIADLEQIYTLGFRGEALASIAAISAVECRSQGQEIRLRAGQVVEMGAAMPTPGTVMEVRNLFALTPARLKFLKSDVTENAACTKVMQSYALLHPEVSFSLQIEGRNTLQTKGRGGLHSAAAAVLGESVAAELQEVEDEQVNGLVSQPRLSRGSRDGILLAVNRRPITSRSLNYALEECYLGSLERGRYPVAVLNLALPPGEVDVNIHPTKREVRFRREREVFATLQKSVRSVLTGSHPYALKVPYTSAPATSTPGNFSLSDLGQIAVHRPTPLPVDLPIAENDENSAKESPAESEILRPLGQIQDSYLIAESPAGVVVIDQHAAHERVLYNYFLNKLNSGTTVASQGLLIPQILEVGPNQVAAAVEQQDRLREFGFELEPFGPSQLRLRAAPAELPAERVHQAAEEMLTLLTEAKPDDRRERLAASLACHSAVRFGDRMESEEQRQLLQELETAENSITCPHGRPTRLVLEWSELKRHFRRNY